MASILARSCISLNLLRQSLLLQGRQMNLIAILHLQHSLLAGGRTAGPFPTVAALLRPSCGNYESNYFASVLVLRLRTTPVYDITHIVEYKDRECRHALPLFGTKRFVEWLPRLGEFIQIG